MVLKGRAGGRGVETYVYIHEQNENIIHNILTSFCWFVISLIFGGEGDSKRGATNVTPFCFGDALK